MLEDRLAPAAGDLDLTFGGDGRVTVDREQSDWFEDVIIQHDGKIVAATASGLTRYNRNGNVDDTFGANGKVILPVNFFFPAAFSHDALALQTDGKILVTGGGGITRLNPNGSMDATFGVGGTVTGIGDRRGIAVSPLDGKIVVLSGGVLIRLHVDGSFDTSFDGDGRASVFFNCRDVAIQSDGKILVAGVISSGFLTSDFAVARYNADGTLDTAFGGDGIVTTDFPNPLGFDISRVLGHSVALQRDGKIVVAGGILPNGSGAFGNESHWKFARYHPDGSLDTSFGSDGRVEVPMADGFEAMATDIVIQPDGRIVATGMPFFGVVRLQPDGSLDTGFSGGFGGDGQVLLDDGRGNAVALQADGKIVLGGATSSSSGGFELIRLQGLTDTDSDGIADSVDSKPKSANNNEFSDVSVGGSTEGRINDRGDQTITVVDALDPSKGVAITTGAGGGPTPAVVSALNNSWTLTLEADRYAVVAPGSVNLDIGVGPIGVVFRAHSGQEYSATISTGNSLTFHPENGTFTAPASNPNTIVVVTGGNESPIVPGETVVPPQPDPVMVEIDVGDDSANLASQGLIAATILTNAGFDAAFVDVNSVYFAGAQAVQGVLSDVDGDGDLDMVLHFRIQDTNLQALYEQLIADDLNGDGVLDSNHQTVGVSLTGATVDDVLFAGEDQMDLFLSGRALRELLDELAAAGAI
jgi:uncharacterized delta-60 repeat protein